MPNPVKAGPRQTAKKHNYITKKYIQNKSALKRHINYSEVEAHNCFVVVDSRSLSKLIYPSCMIKANRNEISNSCILHQAYIHVPISELLLFYFRMERLLLWWPVSKDIFLWLKHLWNTVPPLTSRMRCGANTLYSTNV